jgi:N-hydroxyarylamine O-acetyltransferase
MENRIAMPTSSRFTLQAYLHRIGFTGQARADLATVEGMMRAQLRQVSFENLDIQAGMPISMVPDDIVEKILDRQRGGYCFEVNGLFAMALQALQIPYFFIAARPITHQGVRKPKTHMAVVASLDGESWLCDCGFGGYGIRAPLQLGRLGAEVNQDGELFQLNMLNEQELVLRSKMYDAWEDQYAFDLNPHEFIDFIPANHYNASHPDSLFVRKLLVVRCTPQGRKIMFGH